MGAGERDLTNTLLQPEWPLITGGWNELTTFSDICERSVDQVPLVVVVVCASASNPHLVIYSRLTASSSRPRWTELRLQSFLFPPEALLPPTYVLGFGDKGSVVSHDSHYGSQDGDRTSTVFTLCRSRVSPAILGEWFLSIDHL